ncbi:UNVERIFIED_CONTAM: PadR family transcriptional regulator [Williamsia faeni]
MAERAGSALGVGTDPLHTYDQIAIRLHILTHPVDAVFTDAQVIEELAERHYHVRPAAVETVFVALHAEGLVHRDTTDPGSHTCCVTAAGRMALARERRALRKVVLTAAEDTAHHGH